MSFNAQQQVVDKLFSNKIYVIPRNQRLYVWTSENWKDLLDDLEFTIGLPANSKNYHFIGSIVLLKDESDSPLDTFKVIDGQQRMFTIMMFFVALVQAFKEKRLENEFMGLRDRIIPKDISNTPHCAIVSDYYISFATIVEKICNFNNKDSIHQLFKGLGVLSKLHKDLEDCIQYFYSIFIEKDKNELFKLRDALLATKYVEIIASSEEDSYTIFEILNARGQHLQEHDLVKNYIMRYIQPRDKVDRVKSCWSEGLEKPLGNSMPKFFQHYTKHRYVLTDDQKDSIYKIIKKELKGDNIDDFFQDLLLKAGYYKKLLKPQEIEPNGDKNTEKEKAILLFFQRRKAIQFRPLFLSLMHQKEEGNITPNDYVNALNQIYNFWVCYNIIGQQKSNKLEDVIRKYSPSIEKGCTSNLIDELIHSLKRKLPNKEDFIQAFMSLGYSNVHDFYKDSRNKDRVQIVLEIIEMAKDGCAEDFTIEHANPDSVAEANSNIGNLLPLEKHLNEKLKDKPLNEKLPYYRNSKFAIARSFADRYTAQLFNPKSRAEYMAKLIYEDVLKLG